MIVANVLDTFIDSLDYSLKIVSVSYDSPNNITSFVVNRLLYLRDFSKILVDSVEYSVINVNYSNKSFDIIGNFQLATTLSVKKPYYTHGTPYMANVKLDSAGKVRELTYPIVYLLEVLRESIPSNIDSSIATIPDIRLFFLDESNFKDNDTDGLYSKWVVGQRDFCDFVLASIRKSKLFDYPTQIEIYTFAKFGQYVTDKGSISSVFDKELSGVELRMSLPIRKICDC